MLKIFSGHDIIREILITFSLIAQTIDYDLKYAGYNLIVTSELDIDPLQVHTTYHNLWKIEESFRITKSYLDARPVYVPKKETIYGHFLICYLSLFLLRIMEIKCFKNQVNTYDLINFMRDFRVVDSGDGTFINISRDQKANGKIKKVTSLTNIDALYLTKDEIVSDYYIAYFCISFFTVVIMIYFPHITLFYGFSC